jgi:hypothetical protein
MADDRITRTQEPFLEIRESIPYGSLGPNDAAPTPTPQIKIEPGEVDIRDLDQIEDEDLDSWGSISPF